MVWHSSWSSNASSGDDEAWVSVSGTTRQGHPEFGSSDEREHNNLSSRKRIDGEVWIGSASQCVRIAFIFQRVYSNMDLHTQSVLCGLKH